MPQKCSICFHPRRKEIDGAIAAGEPLRDIARRVSLSKDAISRHKKHVSQAILKTVAKREESIVESILRRLGSLYEKTQRILERAETEGDGRLCILAIKQMHDGLNSLYTIASREDNGSDPRRRRGNYDLQVAVIHIGGKPPSIPDTVAVPEAGTETQVSP